MNNSEQIPVASLPQGSSQSVAAQDAAAIEHRSAAVLRKKDFVTHLCITIKWSLDSVRRRSADALRAASTAAAAVVWPGAGDASC
jgi:hypothetical protein